MAPREEDHLPPPPPPESWTDGDSSKGPRNWLRQKRGWDDIGEGLWRVHDGLYDLGVFMDKVGGWWWWWWWWRGSNFWRQDVVVLVGGEGLRGVRGRLARCF